MRSFYKLLGWFGSLVGSVGALVAQTVDADLRTNYDAAATGGAFTSGVTTAGRIADTAGTGSWNLYSSVTQSPTSGGANLTLLTYSTVANGVRAANAFVVAGHDTYDLPGWSNGVLITPSSSEGAPAANELAVHPGNTNPTFTTAAWTAGFSGTVAISAGLRDLGAVGNGVTFAVYQNGAALLAATATTGNNTISFGQSVSVTLGDTFYFVVGANGDYGGDQAAMSATISAIPEPAHVALMASVGLLGVVGWRRWRVVGGGRT